jgi:hypothetical protein
MRLLRPRREQQKKSDECLYSIALPLLRVVGGPPRLVSPRPAPQGAGEVSHLCRSDARAGRSQGEGVQEAGGGGFLMADRSKENPRFFFFVPFADSDLEKKTSTSTPKKQNAASASLSELEEARRRERTATRAAEEAEKLAEKGD